MRATVQAGELKKRLIAAVALLCKKNKMPALGCVRLEMKSRELIISATDTDMTVTVRAPANGDAGVALVPGRQFLKIIRATAPDEIVTLTIDDKRLVIDLRDARFSLMTLPPDDFFSTIAHDIKANVTIRLPAGWINEHFTKVVEFISTEETRYYLNGVCLHTLQGGLVLVATDGHRLARIFADADARLLLGNERVILPRAAVSYLIKYLPRNTETTIGFVARNTEARAYMVFEADGFHLSTRMIEGTFPDYERVIPIQDAALIVTVESNKLNGILNRLSFAKCATLARQNNRLVISASDLDNGEGSIALPGDAKWLRDCGDVSFNIKYLSSICKSVGATAALSIIDGDSPMTIRPAAGGNNLYVLMPMWSNIKALELPRGAVAA